MSAEQLEIIAPARRYRVQTYTLVYPYVDRPTAGYGVACDADGHVDARQLPVMSRAAYHEARMVSRVRGRPVLAPHIVMRDLPCYEPARARCTCGAMLTLADAVNECRRCSERYDGQGYRLPPRWVAMRLYHHLEKALLKVWGAASSRARVTWDDLH